MRYIKLYEAYSKRRMLPVDETSKIKKDLDDMFIELTDNGFRYELKSGVVGPSKLKDHNTETLYLVIAKPNKRNPFRSNIEIFNTTYFDDTLQLFKQDDVREYVLMFVDYMKGLWGEDIEVDLQNDTISQKKLVDKNDSDYYIDKYFVRIKKRL
jgi:hypothetical protein